MRPPFRNMALLLAIGLMAGCEAKEASLPTRASQPAKSLPASTTPPVARALPLKISLDCGPGVMLELVLIPAGKFMMGSSEHEVEVMREKNEAPQHEVTIAKPFYMGIYEVTQAQWQAVMGHNPSHFKSDGNLPVETVSWYDCQEFCKKLSAKVGRTIRLPSEAEWEYACRAGTTTRYSFRDDKYELETYAWFSNNYEGLPPIYGGMKKPYPYIPEKGNDSGCSIHVVGLKQLNPWGLYDMYGNVSEWCRDTYHDSYAGAPNDGSAWETLGEDSTRVLRGGSYFDTRYDLRSAVRYWQGPDSRHDIYGFRVIVDVPNAP